MFLVSLTSDSVCRVRGSENVPRARFAAFSVTIWRLGMSQNVLSQDESVRVRLLATKLPQ